MREPRKHRCVAQMMAILIQALTKPHTSKYGFPIFLANLDDSICLFADKTICGDYDRCEVSTLFKASLKILLLLLLFMGFQDFHRVLVSIGFGICIGDTDVNDAICSVLPEASDQYISSLLIMVLV